MRIWIRQNKFNENDPLFPNGRSATMSRSGVEKRLKEAAHKALLNSPELTLPAISPHILRHTTAMHMLQSGVPAEVIALWLGHESPSTTHMYVEADLEMKERALAKLGPRKTASLRFRAKDELIRFLESL